MKEYRIDLKIKNNLILKKIEEAGYKTLGEFCRLNGMKNQSSRIGEFINLKRSPLTSEGEFYDIILKISDLLMCSPENLFSEEQMTMELKTNKRSIEVQEAEIKFMIKNNNNIKSLEEIIYNENLSNKIEESLNLLTPREEKVLKMRFGIDDGKEHTLEAIGKIFGVQKERIRQIEAKALRKLRHPDRRLKLLPFTNE